MAISYNDIDISQLSQIDRLLLAQKLWGSLDADTIDDLCPLTPEQTAEIRRRIAEADAGRMPMYSWEEVQQRLKFRKQ